MVPPKLNYAAPEGEDDALPDDAKRLLWLCYSLVNASFPVEVWRQARVPDSGAASMDAVIEPAI